MCIHKFSMAFCVFWEHFACPEWRVSCDRGRHHRSRHCRISPSPGRPRGGSRIGGRQSLKERGPHHLFSPSLHPITSRVFYVRDCLVRVINQNFVVTGMMPNGSQKLEDHPVTWSDMGRDAYPAHHGYAMHTKNGRTFSCVVVLLGKKDTR